MLFKNPETKKQFEPYGKEVSVKILKIIPIVLAVAFNLIFAEDEGVSKKLTGLLASSQQVIIVVSDDWNSSVAKLNCYEKQSGMFKHIGDEISVFLGKSGLGWGAGLIQFNTSVGPIKREGDKRAPAGVFRLPYVFGLLPVDSLKWLKYPYQQISKLNECVDDTSSELYNKIVNTSEINKTWKSSENMDDPDYKYGIVINHNSAPVEKGCGSCIFFHLTGPKRKPTAGCTAMDEPSLLKLLRWIDSSKKTILIQLPESEYEKIKKFIK